ncbi:MAG: cupredoxin domain-containing protein [Chloroflexi bacterium]|nr:cupredoxin domain-containing protein [Chloroflexota bacterium]
MNSRTRKYALMLASLAGRGLSLLLPLGFVALALAATACSGGGDKKEGAPPPAATTGGGGDRAATNVEIAQNDNFFRPNTLTAGPGQEVTLQLTNKGANSHNFRIAGPDGEFETEDDAVLAPADEGGMNPGDSRSLQWIAPGQVGAILFRCDFHPAEMTGTINVGG